MKLNLEGRAEESLPSGGMMVALITRHGRIEDEVFLGDELRPFLGRTVRVTLIIEEVSE